MKNLEYAKAVTRAVVYKRGVAAATLSRQAGLGVVFAYLPEYLKAGGPSIASTLPALDVPVTLSHGSVPAFFAGLLPEGERLAKLRWAVKTTMDDEFSLLVAAGENPWAMSRLLPPGRNPRRSHPS
ncbi:HipA N-terminal domain-containing protein [Arthrobacter alpinus]|nr:HipA N-terminal domain-containing protein [Arthrobacter alpinus]